MNDIGKALHVSSPRLYAISCLGRYFRFWRTPNSVPMFVTLKFVTLSYEMKSNEKSCFIHKSIPFRLFMFEQRMSPVLFNGSGFVFLAGKIFVYDSGSDGLRFSVLSV